MSGSKTILAQKLDYKLSSPGLADAKLTPQQQDYPNSGGNTLSHLLPTKPANKLLLFKFSQQSHPVAANTETTATLASIATTATWKYLSH
eukprot:5661258-Amphidinium_carterae.1